MPTLGQKISVVEPHHFNAPSAPVKNSDAAPAAPAPTLQYRKPIIKTFGYFVF
jgi:hypothetical protein